MAHALSALHDVQRSHAHLLPDHVIEQQVAASRIRFRDRLLPPVQMVRLFLMQILLGNTSMQHLPQLAGVEFAVSSYCQARLKLSLCLLRRLLRWTQDQARNLAPASHGGSRVLLVDCTSFSMPDTPALRKQFGIPKAHGAKPGVSYPVAKMMALLDLASGCFIRMIPGELYRHEASGVVRLHRRLQKGDILVGDRAFCSFVHVALLQACGVFACFRLHQHRRSVIRGIEQWNRPPRAPTWMSVRQFATLPEQLCIRIVRYRVGQKGYRSREFAIATTLMDESLWPDEKIAELYGHRWTIETCFNHLKTTMKMCVLRCQSVGGVTRELMMYQIAYNLVRLAMLQAADRQKTRVDRISFVDAMRHLTVRLLGLPGVPTLIENPDRRGRYCSRVIRRRMKEYDLLSEPRDVRMARDLQGSGA
jgi:hypothetical protein